MCKLGGGTLILTGSDNYAGATTISAGTLQAGSAGSGTNALPSGTAVSFPYMNGATLQLGANQTIGGLSCSMSMSGGSGGSYVNLNSYTLTTSGLYYGGTVYGSGSFNVGGTSTQFWGGDSATATTVTGGTLLLNEGGS